MRLARFAFLVSLGLLGIYYLKIGRYPVYDWAGLLAAVCAYSVLLYKAKISSSAWPFLFAAILLVTGAVLTIPFANQTGRAGLSAALLIYMVIVWVPLGAATMRDTRDFRRALMALSLSMVLTSLYALGQRFLGWPCLAGIDFYGRATGLLRQPNELGVFCGMVFPYTLCLVASANHKVEKLFWCLVGGIGVAGLVVSGSMTGTVVLVIGCVVYAFLSRLRTRVWLVGIALIAIVVGAIVLTGTGAGRGETTFRRIAALGTSAGRITIYERLEGYRTALNEIKGRPLRGYGYHAYVSGVRNALGDEKKTLVHDMYLRAWLDGGLFTLLGIVVVLAYAVQIAIRIRRRVQRFPELCFLDVYAIAAISSFSGFFVMTLPSPTLYQRSNWFPVVILLAMTSILRKFERSGRRIFVAPWWGRHEKVSGACAVNGEDNGSNALRHG